ncbi:MAG: redoxin domain-containing protein [Planctomycetota bacterium]|jgi:thiol-disulfide isomerase/thioredoxin
MTDHRTASMRSTRPAGRLALVLATVLIAAHAQAQSTAPDAQWEAAAALKSARRYAEAVDAFVAYAEANPGSPRAVDAMVEAGLARFAQGRAAQKLHRNPPAAEQAFRQSIELLDRAVALDATHPSAPRAMYMSGSAAYFLWDLPAAAERYATVVSGYGPADSYYAKAAVRQAEVLFSLLEHERAIDVLGRYQAERPGERDAQAQRATKYLQYARQFGRPAPPLSVTDWVQGGPQLLSELRGRPVALYFSTFWCPNCRKEREFVKDLARRSRERGLVFIEVTDASRGQTLESVRKSVRDWKIEHPVAFDGRGKTFISYQGRSIPNLVLIDRLGNVRWHDHVAAVPDWTIDQLLAGQR